MSSHFKISLALISVASMLLMAAGAWMANRLDRRGGAFQPIRSLALSAKDREEVLYNSTSHILTIVTSSGTVREYTRNPDIHYQKDGKVIVNRKLFGLEVSPYLGVGYSSRANAYVGVNLLDAWRFDAGVALALGGSTRPLLSLGYNVWSNTSINVGLDLNKVPHILLTVGL